MTMLKFSKFNQTRKNSVGNKFNASKVKSYKGTFDSKLEYEYSLILDDDVRLKRIIGYNRQVAIDLYGINKTRVASYKLDFLIHHKDESLEYVEVKGYPTDTWRLKWKLAKDWLKSQPAGTKLTLVDSNLGVKESHKA